MVRTESWEHQRVEVPSKPSTRQLDRCSCCESEVRVAIATHWLPYCKLASHNVHANPKGILYKIGLAPSENLILTGPSNYGLADPGRNTAITLAQLSTALGTIQPTVDSLVLLNVVGELSREVGRDFEHAHRRLRARHSVLSARRKRPTRTADR